MKYILTLKKNPYLPFRINILIGKNGTGKTQLLCSMVNSISGIKSNYKYFTPYNPLFRKVIAISYSLFDDFPKPPETTVFSYKYIGIRSSNEETISDNILGEKLRNALHIILKNDRSEMWFDSIRNIIDLNNLGLSDPLSLNKEWIDSLSYQKARRLSSGQSITLFILTELVANIKNESLILFDEPETHLHPSAIAALINSFYSILEKYDSFAILSTHSPIILQDVPSKYVTIFDREGDIPIIRSLPLESFGENISTLTSKIFETVGIKELYKKHLDQIALLPQEIIDELFEKGLSINALLYIETLRNIYKNEES